MPFYRVTAPYVTVRLASPTGGETVLGFYEGGVLPDSAVPESVQILITKGMVEEIEGPEAKAIEKSHAEQKKAEEDAAAQRTKDAEAAGKKVEDDRKEAEAAAKQAEAEQAAADKAAAKPVAVKPGN